MGDGVGDLSCALSRRRRFARHLAVGLAVAGSSLMLTAAASAAPPRGQTQWPAYLGGGDSSQYSALDQINRTNVGKLAVAWTYPAGEGAAYRFNPLVVNGVMYVLAQRNSIVALDPQTGKELWRHANTGLVGARGMNYWQSAEGRDRRLLYVNDGMLTEISADTGEPVAAFGKAGKVDLRDGFEGDVSKMRALQTDNPGRVYKNLIIMSLPASTVDYASAPADIHAYDIRTGKLAWRFHVVPHQGEFGADTWPAKDLDKFGGVHNWSESTIDEASGIVYIPTGTARYDHYGGNRQGDNLFANSILALDARNGKRIWHFQTIHHDLWDYDLPQAPKLLTLKRGGKNIPVVAQASKQGFLFVLDRRTGKPIWPIEERPVPASDVPGEKASPTQPFPTAPPPFARQSFTEADINPYVPEADREKVRQLLKTARNEGLFTPPSLRGTISMPGHNGGANWGTSAIDPARQRFYVLSKQLPTLDKLSPDDRPEALASMPNAGSEVRPYRAPVDFILQSNGLSAIGPPWSTITAYDLNEGKILWQVPDGDIPSLAQEGVTGTGSHWPRGSPVATAGGLLFAATASDRKFRARDADTGKVVWEYDLPAASEGVPAVYQAGGRQFVVIPVGGVGIFSKGFGLPAPGPNQYMAFALPEGAAPVGGR
jgi:quinoprotein glucose dehydrogenase